MSRPVVSVLGDAGGAEAVGPALSALVERGTLGPVLAGSAAKPALRRLGIGSEPPTRSKDAARALLRSARPGAVVTGTSWGAVRPELDFIAAARDEGIPSLAVIDFWSNYRARFVPAGAAEPILPDRIAVPDERARREAIADGLPEALLTVTGNPHHESLLRRYAARAADGSVAFRQRIGVPAEATLVLFASQPIGALYGERLGYTESSVTRLLLGALDRIAEWLGYSLTLAIRPHPREDRPMRPEPTARVSIIDASGDDPIEWCLASDLVTGMSSAVLFDAALLGARVLSVQPGLIGPDPLPANRLGISTGVYLADEIPAAIYRALARPASLGPTRTLTELRRSARGAIGRLVAEIDMMRSNVSSGVFS